MWFEAVLWPLATGLDGWELKTTDPHLSLGHLALMKECAVYLLNPVYFKHFNIYVKAGEIASLYFFNEQIIKLEISR